MQAPAIGPAVPVGPPPLAAAPAPMPRGPSQARSQLIIGDQIVDPGRRIETRATDSPVTLFIGSKGGSGTTTLCTELARAMGGKGNVALVDADLTGRRSVAVHLRDRAQSRRGASRLGRYRPSRADGVTVVELVDRYDAAFTLGEATVEAFVAGMTGFKAILVDAPQPFAADGPPVRLRARRFFLVLEPTLLGVAGAQSLLADLERFGVPADRIDLVTNARSATEPVPRKEIEGVLQSHIVAEIPLSTSKTYAKSIATLQQYVEALPTSDAPPKLQPSTGSPMGAQSNGRARFAGLRRRTRRAQTAGARGTSARGRSRLGERRTYRRGEACRAA